MDISTESDLMPTAASDTKDCKSKRIKILKKSITKRNANDKKPYLLKKKLYSIYKKPKRICTNKENEESVGDEDSRDAVALLEDIWSSTNDSLECKARKSKLSKRNVKTILKHVISNEHVIKMVQNTVLAETGHTSNLEEAEFLPRLTRSKVKALQGTSQELMSHNNVGSPTKQNHCVTVPVDHFLQKELAESEDSSDEEYEPSDEAEDTSEGEEEISCSLDTSKDDAGSPTLSPKEASPKSLSADDVYKDSTSMIAEPSLNNTNEFDNQVSEVALRTRSKLPLHDTPLEELEAAFVAPDISVDMYDTGCRDPEWLKFLQNFTKPIESRIENGLDASRDDDDEEGDPDFDFLEEEWHASLDEDMKWDSRDDKAVKVSEKELRELLKERQEAAEQSYFLYKAEQLEEQLTDYVDIEKTADCLSQNVSWSPSTDQFLYPDNCFQMLAQSMTVEEKLQLQEQMRMHVQLLSQTYLLSIARPQVLQYGSYARKMLEELDTLSQNVAPDGNGSFFNAHNLHGALEIVQSPLSVSYNSTVGEWSRNRIASRYAIGSDDVKEIMAFNKTFLYVDLLPRYGFRPHVMQGKGVFTAAEDNLLALGLEEMASFSPPSVKYSVINSLLLPTKSVVQISNHVKSARKLEGNPICYYFLHKEAPCFPRTIIPFDQNHVKVPAEASPDVWPPWMKNLQHNVEMQASKSCKLTKVQPDQCLSESSDKQCSPSNLGPLRKGSPKKIFKELRFDIESSLSSFSTLHDNIDEPPKISYSSTQTSSDNFNHISQQKAVKDRNDVCIYFQTQYPLKRNLLDGGVKKVELDFRRKSSSNSDDVWELPSKRPRSMPTCKKRSSLSKRKGAKNRAQLHSMSPKRCHPDDDNKQSEGSNEFADCYVAEVVNALRKEPQKLEKFLLTVSSFKEDEESYKKLHEHVKEILSGYPSLLEGFSLFKPEKR